MSARRRRAALYALGALGLALLMAILASSVESDTHRGVLIAVSLGWLVISAFCIASFLRTQAVEPAPDAGDPVEPA